MISQQIQQRWPAALPYWQLVRLDRPIGSLLLLWPTWWALWIAAKGWPGLHLFVVFTLGVILTRAAGCAVNDFADRNIDGHVKRTNQRPLATGAATPKGAMMLFGGLMLLAFLLVLTTNKLTVLLSLPALALAFCYPFAKRYTHLPQVVLGSAFSMGIPMAFAATTGEVPAVAWLLFTANLLWTVAYDTFYAMVDRDDDLKIGVKSTAILFGDMDRVMTASLQVMVILALLMLGSRESLGALYYCGLAVAAGLFGYQQWLVRERQRDDCFKAFLNNNWVGATIFMGIFFHFLAN
ncbi:4-hydroxybenzoate octaprenyltransferase [Microbulbifer hydrolyticus]|uniref:4-hydroxybenzoate octaprenyltransferase n=1 Tax=Microbulbifer hydrolyticus TaxID=48074 RepID=A0A6P1T7U2_9GAMM|nr:4-hydroxybenzoate octaprenyltransferase [Microbulbifer hydrolyticus]MBB5211683.1 4-hydroxybenzoate polyprenyltransferase [Microbulbifer hydrolyticus]QHQ37586.1 4-hydroxybenzoate octaprenyltransferase [Microbulbifer hydrolyticus]